MGLVRRALSRALPASAKDALRSLATRLDGKRRLYVINRHRQVICCTMRDDDLFRMEEYARRNGFILVDCPQLADVLLLNTCAFDKEREEWCLKLIQEFSAYRGRLLVTGCIGRINEPAMDKVLDGEYVAAPELDTRLDAAFANVKCPFASVVVHGQEGRLYDGGLAWRTVTMPERVPAVGAVKIVNGCPCQCAYCTHRLAIGQKARSEPFNKIVSIIEAQVEQGAEVIQLLGDNLGPYGADIHSHVPELVQKLSNRFPSVRFALDQYHAAFVVRDYPWGLRDVIQDGLVYELKVPLQSGCSRVLDVMKRRTNLPRLEEYMTGAYTLAPDMLVVTHIITGFPSETEDEFHESVDYVRRVFNHRALVFVFPCSVHPDTEAALIEPRLPSEVALSRALKAEQMLLDAGIDVCLDHLDVLKERGIG